MAAREASPRKHDDARSIDATQEAGISIASRRDGSKQFGELTARSVARITQTLDILQKR
jgi:hypothetical protein